MGKFYTEIVTPEKRFFSDDIESLVIKTPEGEIGVLKGHTPMVVAVQTGIIKIKKDGEWLEAVVTEGFMEIQNNITIILVDAAEWPHEIDENRAKEAVERAESRIKKHVSDLEYVRSTAAFVRASERLKLVKKYKTLI